MPSIGVLEHNQKPTDKPTRRIKRSGGQSLVRSGLAEWIKENVLLRIKSLPHASLNAVCPDGAIRGTHRKLLIPDEKPSQSPRMGKLRWEPPKNKRQLKAHPWQNLIVAGR